MRLGARTALAKASRPGPTPWPSAATGAAAVSTISVRDELDILIRSRRRDYSQLVQCWADENLLELECKEIGEHYGRYRLHLPEAERAMARSLERYGQLSPVVVCRRQERHELIDGFKRLGGGARSGAPVACLGPAHGRRRADGQGSHLRVESRWGPHARVGRGLDYSSTGPRRWHDPSRGGGVVGAAQKLGMPAAGTDRAVGTQGAG